MASGNNGNILQHFVELEAAQGLLSAPGAGGLRCVFTHGMAPFEGFQHPLPENDAKTRVMGRALRMSERLRKGLDPREGQSLLFQAFGDLDVGQTHYPNSGVLMDWLARQRNLGLRMAIAETSPAAQAALVERWPGAEEDARVKVFPESWRALLKEGTLQLRGPANWPWLVSMDPHTFDPAAQGPARDGGSVSADDLKSLTPFLGTAFDAGPGVFALFCYSMSTALRQKFQGVMREWASTFGRPVGVAFVGCHRDGSSAHCGALMSHDQALLAALEKAARRFFGKADYAPAL
jgi:hypothetical protein